MSCTLRRSRTPFPLPPLSRPDGSPYLKRINSPVTSAPSSTLTMFKVKCHTTSESVLFSILTIQCPQRRQQAGRAIKKEQGEISRNHVHAFLLDPVYKVKITLYDESPLHIANERARSPASARSFVRSFAHCTIIHLRSFPATGNWMCLLCCAAAWAAALAYALECWHSSLLHR